MMKRVMLTAVIAAMLLSGCAVFDTVLHETIGTAERAAVQELSSGYEMRMHEALFSMTYAQVFSLGGYHSDDTGYQEGEVVSWRMEIQEGNDIIRYDAKRGMLREEADGTAWWYLELTSEGETYAYAALLDENLSPQRVRYQEEETGRIREFSYELDSPVQQASAAGFTGAGYPEDMAFDEAEYGEAVTGTERITVPAGSYTADTLTYTVSVKSSLLPEARFL